MRSVAGLIATLLVSIPLNATAADPQDGWTERLSFKGDLRLRYEGIDEEGTEYRSRGRYRARLALTADLLDDVKVIIQLASGADDPVSRNVTFDGGFNVDDIGFDLAYVQWAAGESLTVYGGKMKNPLYSAGDLPLLWDSDLNPEGFAATYRRGMFFGTLAGFSAEERSSSGNTLLTAVQAGGTFVFGDDAKLTAGVGYIGYSNTAGNEPLWDGLSHGNSVDVDGDYLYDYRNTEVFAQLDAAVGRLPLMLAAQWAKNSEVDDENTAYAVGARIGAITGKGTWEATWAFMDIEADSVIAIFNDSDFGGGQTDAIGHILQFKYALSGQIELAGTYFDNEIDRIVDNEHGYKRYQLDIQFSFK